MEGSEISPEEKRPLLSRQTPGRFAACTDPRLDTVDARADTPLSSQLGRDFSSALPHTQHLSRLSVQ